MNEIITSIIVSVASVALTTIIGWIGVIIKNSISAMCDTKTKQAIAKAVVNAIEQTTDSTVYTGEYKLSIATEHVQTILKSKGIKISDLELRMLIESAVKEMNEGWTGIKNEILELGEPEYVSDEIDAMYEANGYDD